MLRLLVAVLTTAVLLVGPPAHAVEIEGYASYQPQTSCSPRPKPGTTTLGHWLVDHRGGGFGGISRPCTSGGTSEHKEGRAFDWTLDATRKKDRQRAHRFLEWVRASDNAGHTDAKARRLGIMYLIWNDHMYAAWSGFRREDYLSSSCRSRRRCSTTLRHRDHLHISLSRRGARGRTSWYDGRL